MKKLLLICDEDPALEMLKTSLTKQGYEVMTAQSAKEGLKNFEQQRPKLVLIDVKRPDMDGLEILKRVKAMDRGAEVVIMTSQGDPESAIAALTHGASDVITKPVENELLFLVLKRAWEKTAISEHLKGYDAETLEKKVAACTEDLRQAREGLRNNKRLASIGEGVARLFHYLKNILTGLRGGMHMVNTGQAKNKPDMTEDGWAMVQRNIQNLEDLVFDVLRYAKERTPERSVCRPNKIVSEAMELFRNKAEEYNVQLHTILDPQIEEAYIDPDGFRNVLLNLISNGIDACMYDTDTSKAWQVIAKSELTTDADANQTMLFQITDNGTGMTDEVKAKLFTMFFSTKGGRGSGLGLPGSKKIIEEHGGEISVESAVGQGSTFSVRLRYDMPKEF